LNQPLFRLRHGFVRVEKTSDISSNSSIGSLVTPAAAGDFFDNATPVVTVERSADMIECERIVVATASRATATNPEINKRFMENSVGSICSVACTTALRPTVTRECDLRHLSRSCF
jgi:hypothetical protein